MNIIFLFSQPRSGSTLLQRILGGHSEVHTVAEPWALLHPIYALKWKGVESEYQSHLARQGLQDLLSTLPEGEEAYYASLRAMFGWLYGRVLEQSGKKFFLDKTPRYYFVIREIQRIFPEATFVWLLRNPLAVLSSVLDTWYKSKLENLWDDTPMLDLFWAPFYLVDGLRYLERAGLKGGAVTGGGPPRVPMVVQYEKLVEQPSETMRRVCAGIGLGFEEEMLEYGKKPAPKGRFGDPVSIKKQGRPSTGSVQKWVEHLRSTPELLGFARDYLQVMGPRVVGAMGYSYEELSAHLEVSSGGEKKSGSASIGVKTLEEVLERLGGKGPIPPEAERDPHPHKFQADAQFRSRKYEEAAGIYAKLLQVFPGELEVLLPLGLSLFRSGDLAGARAVFERAV